MSSSRSRNKSRSRSRNRSRSRIRSRIRSSRSRCKSRSRCRLYLYGVFDCIWLFKARQLSRHIYGCKTCTWTTIGQQLFEMNIPSKTTLEEPSHPDTLSHSPTTGRCRGGLQQSLGGWHQVSKLAGARARHTGQELEETQRQQSLSVHLLKGNAALSVNRLPEEEAT